jgi:hypothetical protein
MESQFFTIPVTSQESGLTGYYLVPGIGAYRHTYPGNWLFPKQDGATAALISGAAVDDFKPWDDPYAQWLKGWDEDLAIRRKLVSPIPQNPDQPQAPAPATPPSNPPEATPQPAEAQSNTPSASPVATPVPMIAEPTLATPEETEEFIKPYRRFKGKQKP